MKIDIESMNADLRRELWSFELYTFSGSDPSLKLVAWTCQTRTTTRHKWKEVKWWEDEPFRRDLIPPPEIPPEVKEGLGSRLCDMMRDLVERVK